MREVLVNTDYLPELIDNNIPYQLPNVRFALVSGKYIKDLERLGVPYN